MKLTVEHSHYADTGPHSGQFFVRLSGYVTAEELADLERDGITTE